MRLADSLQVCADVWTASPQWLDVVDFSCHRGMPEASTDLAQPAGPSHGCVPEPVPGCTMTALVFARCDMSHTNPHGHQTWPVHFHDVGPECKKPALGEPGGLNGFQGCGGFTLCQDGRMRSCSGSRRGLSAWRRPA